MEQGLDHRRRRTSTRTRRTRRSTRSASTTCGRTSSARTTAARRGRRSSTGIPDGATINVVREDPEAARPALRRNRDAGLGLVRRRRPLVRRSASTCRRRRFAIWCSRTTTSPSARTGAAFWILDDIDAAAPDRRRARRRRRVTLFKPATATRVRYSKYPDTPIPPDEPGAQNPPEGAILEAPHRHHRKRPVHPERRT